VNVFFPVKETLKVKIDVVFGEPESSYYKCVLSPFFCNYSLIEFTKISTIPGLCLKVIAESGETNDLKVHKKVEVAFLQIKK